MATFLPCPSCGRHVRTSEHACPFCGHGERGRTLVGRILSPLPELLPALVLGFGLTACDSPRPAEKYGGPPPRPPEMKAEELTEDTPEPEASAGQAEGEGDEAGEEPRPAEKYGGPPAPDGPLDEPDEPLPEDPPKKPEVEPIGDDQIAPAPQPTKKYGAPPRPQPTPDKPTKPG